MIEDALVILVALLVLANFGLALAATVDWKEQGQRFVKFYRVTGEQRLSADDRRVLMWAWRVLNVSAMLILWRQML